MIDTYSIQNRWAAVSSKPEEIRSTQLLIVPFVSSVIIVSFETLAEH